MKQAEGIRALFTKLGRNRTADELGTYEDVWHLHCIETKQIDDVSVLMHCIDGRQKKNKPVSSFKAGEQVSMHHAPWFCPSSQSGTLG